MDNLRPLSIARDGDGLLIRWADGTATFVSFDALRKGCPCATCLEEQAKPANPFRILSPAEVAAGAPQPIAMKPVGHYAYQITWNDGHDTGIYPLKLLRQLGTERSA